MKRVEGSKVLCQDLHHICKTQTRWPNLARNVITIGPRDHIKCALELAAVYAISFISKLNFSCVCNINTLLFRIVCLVKLILFPYEKVKHYILLAVNF